MIDSKKSLFALAILVVIVANIFTVVISQKDDQFKIANTTLSTSIQMLSKSTPFQGSVYNFKVSHISGTLTDLIHSYDEQNFGVSVCISIQLFNFRTEDQESQTFCSEGESMVKLTSADRVSDVDNGELRLIVLKKDLGSISWFIAPSYNRPLLQKFVNYEFVPYFSAFFQVAVIAWFGLVTMRGTNEGSEQGGYDVETQMELAALREEMNVQGQTLEMATKRFATIEKIIDNNKSKFFINKDISYVEYEHPTANIYYLDGRNNQLRSSLVDLENSFPVHLVKVNRSILVSQNFLSSGNATIQKKGDKSYLILKLKNKKTKEIEIGATYAKTITSIMTNEEKDS